MEGGGVSQDDGAMHQSIGEGERSARGLRAGRPRPDHPKSAVVYSLLVVDLHLSAAIFWQEHRVAFLLAEREAKWEFGAADGGGQ